MPTFTEVLPKAKSGPAAIDWVPAGVGRGTVTISQKRLRCEYRVAELGVGTDFDGRGMRFEKVDEEAGSDPTEAAYFVFVARRGGHTTCDCKGFQRWGRCKHADAAVALLANGWLDLPAAE